MQSRLALLALTLALLLPAQANKTEAPAPFGFQAPEVLLTDWSARSLNARDLDGDKRTDLAVINNDKARIDLFLQRQPGEKPKERTGWQKDRWEPVLDDARFEKLPLVTSVFMYDLALGDLNHDGKIDLAYTTDDEEIVLRLQEKEDDDDFSFGKEIRTAIDDMIRMDGSLQFADIDADGHEELWLLTREAIESYRLNDRGLLQRDQRLVLSVAGAEALLFSDLNGDKRTDLALRVKSKSHTLRVRYQTEAGGFGPEVAFDLDQAGYGPILLDNARLATLSNEGTLELQQLEADPNPATLLPLRLSSISTPSEESSVPFAWGDIDGDGRTDLLSADPKGAEAFVFRQTKDGTLAKVESFPTFAEVRSLSVAQLDNDKGLELLTCSPAEQAIGISHYKAGRLSFPKTIATSGRPVIATTANVIGDESPEILLVARESTDRILRVLARKNGTWETATELEIKSLRSDPSAIKAMDANQDGLIDIAVFAPFKPMSLALQTKDGDFEITDETEAFGEGFMDKVPHSAVSLKDIDNDGKDEILVGKTGYLRAIRLGKNSEVEVVEQFNASSSGFNVSACAFADITDQTEGDELLLFDARSNSLEVHARTKAGIYERRETLDLPALEARNLIASDFDNDKQLDLLIEGKTAIFRLEVEPNPTIAKSMASFETDLKDVNHSFLASGDLNDDGKDDILLVDNSESRVLEILSRKGNHRNWESAYHFTIFESDRHYRGRKGSEREPRDILIQDVTADSRNDIIMLVHDRILVYPQD